MATLIVGLLMIVGAIVLGGMRAPITGIVGFGMLFIGVDLVHINNEIQPPKPDPVPRGTLAPTAPVDTAPVK